jgi:RNA polymerase sigma factor (sigma-70 family)
MTLARSSSTNLAERMRLASEVFAEYGSLIQVIIDRNIKDHALADDIYQDVFLSVVEEPVPTEGNIVAYLYKRVTNDIIDEVRRAKNYRDRLGRYSLLTDRDSMQDCPEMTAIQLEETQNMLNLMTELLESYEKRAVMRRHFYGDSIAEAAKSMNVKKRTLSHYASVAIRKIKEYWSQNESVTDEIC